jgi:hypothetical protein
MARLARDELQASEKLAQAAEVLSRQPLANQLRFEAVKRGAARVPAAHQGLRAPPNEGGR